MEIKECVICHGILIQVIAQPTMQLMKCSNCHFVQSKFQDFKMEEYKKKDLPNANYAKHDQMLLAIVKKASDSVFLGDGDKVLDIGCGDGGLLGWYRKGVTTVGIDPSVEAIKAGMNAKSIDIGISDFFSEKAVNDICKLMGAGLIKFKVITAVGVLDLVERPVQFIKDCKALIHDEGVIVIQVNYLVDMIRHGKFNRVDAKTYGYYCVLTMRELIARAELDLQGIELQEDGGTFRAYITKKGFDRFGIANYENKLWLLNNANIKMVEEMRFGIDNVLLYEQFGSRASQQQNDMSQSRRIG